MGAKLRKINRYVISFQDIFCRLHASLTIEKRLTSYWGIYNKCDSGLNKMPHQGRLPKAKDAHPAKKTASHAGKHRVLHIPKRYFILSNRTDRR